jgi:glutamate-1-semialdehyde 2,1-aminomutase
MGVSRSTLVFRPYPFFSGHGDGAYLVDLDGNRYLDLVNNYTSLIHGHTHRPTRDAIVRAVDLSPSPGVPTTLEEELAREVMSRIPSIESLRFAVSGSEAVLCAIRAARQFTGRSRIVKFEGAFHGAIDDVQRNIGQPPMEAGSFGAGTPATGGVPTRDTVVAVYNDIESLRGAFERHGDEIAAVIIEPYLGNAALIDAEPEFLATTVEVAQQCGALTIFDEIQSCRIVPGGAQALYGIKPDLTTMGKTIGGGLPLALAGGRGDVMSVYDGFEPAVVQTGTFNAFPLSLAAAMATLDDWRQPDFDRLNSMGEAVRTGLREIFDRHEMQVCVNGRGSMFHITCSAEPVTRYRTHAEAPSGPVLDLHHELLGRGIAMMARGTGCLSTAMDEADISFFLGAVESSVASLSDSAVAS